MMNSLKKLGAAAMFALTVSTPTNAQDSQSVNVALFSWPGYGFWFVAQEKNLVPELDLNIQIIEDPYQTFALMEAGQIDVSSSTAEYAPFAAAEGNNIRLAAYTNVSYGTDKIILAPGIETAQDIKGKTVAVLEGGLSQIYFAIWLEQQGVGFDEVTFSNLIMDDATAAMISGQVAGGAFWEPFGSTVIDALDGSNTVASSEVAEWTSIGLLADSLYMTSDLLNDKPDAAKLALEAYFAGVSYWKENPEEANKIIADALGFPLADVVSVIGDSGDPKLGGLVVFDQTDAARFMGVSSGDPELGDLGLKNGGIEDHFALTAQWWQKFGFIDEIPAYEAGVDTSAIGALVAAD